MLDSIVELSSPEVVTPVLKYEIFKVPPSKDGKPELLGNVKEDEGTKKVRAEDYGKNFYYAYQKVDGADAPVGCIRAIRGEILLMNPKTGATTEEVGYVNHGPQISSEIHAEEPGLIFDMDNNPIGRVNAVTGAIYTWSSKTNKEGVLVGYFTGPKENLYYPNGEINNEVRFRRESVGALAAHAFHLLKPAQP